MGSLQPKPLFVRILAQTFNRFPTEEQYLEWFKASGLTDITWKHVTNPWNTQQYAIAICGTKPSAAEGGAEAARAPAAHAPASSVSRRLRSLAYLPIALVRFGLAVGAFTVVGPLQVMNAAMGMRRMRLAKQ